MHPLAILAKGEHMIQTVSKWMADWKRNRRKYSEPLGKVTMNWRDEYVGMGFGLFDSGDRRRDLWV